MNTVGAYDGIDMAGISPAWFESYVSADDQRTVLRYDVNLRIIWTPRYEGYRVISRSLGAETPWADGYLHGWACAWLRKPPLDKLNDVEGTLAELRFIDKMKNFASKKAADKATEEGWLLNDRVRLDKLRHEIGDPIEAAMLERARTPGHILDREDERQRDVASGKRHVRRGAIFVPVGMGRR